MPTFSSKPQNTKPYRVAKKVNNKQWGHGTKKSRALSSPACRNIWENVAAYFFFFLRREPARPTSPEPRRSMVAGSGTGAGGGVTPFQVRSCEFGLLSHVVLKLACPCVLVSSAMRSK